VANVFASVAEWERDMIAQRTTVSLAAKRAKRAKRAKGEQIGRAAVVDDAKLAKRIRTMRDKGMTMRAIAEKLTAEVCLRSGTGHGGR
jgi:DNA invertase Pin-like site-specific DNA recombinase